MVNVNVNVLTGIDGSIIFTNDEIVLAPNPVEYTLTILTALDLSGSHITITDITGRDLMKSTGGKSIDVCSLDTGAYIISIVTSDGNKVCKTFY